MCIEYQTYAHLDEDRVCVEGDTGSQKRGASGERNPTNTQAPRWRQNYLSLHPLWKPLHLRPRVCITHSRL